MQLIFLHNRVATSKTAFMKKDNIIQFVGFLTTLETEEFAPHWEQYSKQFMTMPGTTVLHQAINGTGKFRYISQHQYLGQDIRFVFMKGRNSDHFQGQKVKVVQAGGYMPLQLEGRHDDEKTAVRIMAFISHGETDISPYSELPCQYLNIYQAYYESCNYGHILEFFTDETNATQLLQQLKIRPGVEVAMYTQLRQASLKLNAAKAGVKLSKA
jgi:hypothetical protein